MSYTCVSCHEPLVGPDYDHDCPVVRQERRVELAEKILLAFWTGRHATIGDDTEVQWAFQVADGFLAEARKGEAKPEPKPAGDEAASKAKRDRYAEQARLDYHAWVPAERSFGLGPNMLRCLTCQKFSHELGRDTGKTCAGPPEPGMLHDLRFTEQLPGFGERFLYSEERAKLAIEFAEAFKSWHDSAGLVGDSGDRRVRYDKAKSAWFDFENRRKQSEPAIPKVP